MDRLHARTVGENVEGDLVSPRVTVLMGVYNSPLRMLDEAMESVLAQTRSDFELLIIDDGSDDEDLIAHLDSRASRDDRIRVVHEPHRGLTASLNRGLLLARGEYVARQDADDWSDSRRLAIQVEFLDQHRQVAVVGTNAWTHQQDRRRLWRTRLPLSDADVRRAFPSGNPFIHGSTMFRKEAALAQGGYCETFRCSQDYDFFWRLAERHEVANLDEPLYHYRYTSGSISAGRALDQLRAHQAIRKLAEARSQGTALDPIVALAAATRELADGSGVLRTLLKQADHCMLAGDYGQAARSYLELVREHPAAPMAWAKFLRLGLFRAVPMLREASFR